jgi:hypothetical protein
MGSHFECDGLARLDKGAQGCVAPEVFAQRRCVVHHAVLCEAVGEEELLRAQRPGVVESRQSDLLRQAEGDLDEVTQIRLRGRRYRPGRRNEPWPR